MESRPVLETRKQIQPETIDEAKASEKITEQIAQPRFERRQYKKYHSCQRWVRHSFHR